MRWSGNPACLLSTDAVPTSGDRDTVFGEAYIGSGLHRWRPQ